MLTHSEAEELPLILESPPWGSRSGLDIVSLDSLRNKDNELLSSLPTEGMSWVSVTSCLYRAAAFAVCFAAIGIVGGNIDRKWGSPNAALGFASVVVVCFP